MPTTEDSNQFIDVNFIFVNPSINNLIVALATDYPMLTEAFQLLEAIQRAPDFTTGLPSPKFTTLVECIEQANPNIPGISEDKTNASWGHQQFKGWKSALPSWNLVGSPLNTQRLAAAIVKTCQVARHLCQHRDITGVSYLGDMYLMNVMEHLWELWKASGGPIPKGKEKAPAAVTQPSDMPNSPAIQDSNPALPSDNLRTQLQTLTIDELKDWIVKSPGLVMPTGARIRKDVFVSCIFSATPAQHPSEEDFAAISNKRKGRKPSRRT
ncbi:hypothetical protein JAAARDRAFT_41432 [Jaapia argillacea MUCL 33604]|uniref:Uncharacterized protein n=1 Tax=Jaapia argillacea MUCL 33604 TaxID=933084 RepID=A0A067PBF9_9AGAM|nr:hypothetical protein JAAARDRAFT_41432 [Jaapia argillacea MUCL 33604]